jgi:uncharacterized paraquat-inducible protein A
MKCPHCDSGVSLFSPSINRGRRRSKCPHCGASVRTKIRHKKALLLILGVDLALMVMAPTLSPAYGALLFAAVSFVAAGVGIVALTKFELVSGEPQGKHHA